MACGPLQDQGDHAAPKFQQPAARQRVVRRVGQNKAKRHQGVKQKIEGNIEKTARIGQSASPGQRAVEAVQQAVKHYRRQRRLIPAQG